MNTSSLLCTCTRQSVLRQIYCYNITMKIKMWCIYVHLPPAIVIEACQVTVGPQSAQRQGQYTQRSVTTQTLMVDDMLLLLTG